MRVLLTGANGLLGSTIQEHFPASWELVALGKEALDIRDAARIAHQLQHYQPDVLLNCAAYTAVDKAETEVDLAMSLNATGPSLLAQATASVEVPLVHISTDFVFDGTKPSPYLENDSISPLSVYGHTKALGERFVRQHNPQHLVVRTAWLYGDRAPGFPHLLIKLAQRGALRVVTDQRGSPTYAPHLAEGLFRAIANQCRGTLHLTGAGSATRYEWAECLMEHLQVDVDIGEALASDFATDATRPENSALHSDHPGKFQLPDWRDGVAAFAASQTH